MRRVFLFVVLNVLKINCHLWPKGVVHYGINKKDYDLHSQDEIMSTFAKLEKEICIKFFNSPYNKNTSKVEKYLFISNQDRSLDCPPATYDYGNNIISMTIGYKCINPKDIASVTVEMLRSSVENKVSVINSFDLIRKFQPKVEEPRSTLLSAEDRNFINAHYAEECSQLGSRPGIVTSYRRTIRFGKHLASSKGEDLVEKESILSEENKKYYEKKTWPLGIVMYGVHPDLRNSTQYKTLRYAMTVLEIKSCVVFQEMPSDGVLSPKNFLWFSKMGDDYPDLGFVEGNQTINLSTMVSGAAGHVSHPQLMLLRSLGIPMVSNRPDRDNYVNVIWKNVDKGKEHYLERMPVEAWLRRLPYDFDSLTHAPANFMCGQLCLLGAQTVQPLQDHLWQRSKSMGRAAAPSAQDVSLLQAIYGRQCQKRAMRNKP